MLGVRRLPVAAVVGVCVAAALALGLLARPAPTRLPTGHSGDAELAALAREVIGENRPALAVAAITPAGTRTATIGATPEDRFEIGSISKGLTGLLFADMIARGEVHPDSRVGEFLRIDGPVADVRLAQLATHSSGLPTLPPTFGTYLRGYWSGLTAGNPYSASVEQHLADLASTPLDAPPGTYSNSGFQLLGATLAAAAGTPYPQLLAERVLSPLGMNDTIVAVSPADLGPRDLYGETPGGRHADPWLGPAMAPAGGVRAGIRDMATLAEALLAGTAPGGDALRPREPLGQDRIGWAWITTTSPHTGHQIVWHNGGTGGFSTYLGIDPEAGVAVVVLSAASESVDGTTPAGFRLLERIGGAE